jgi:hypothetical protein
MKAIKITDDAHARLTNITGLLMAKSRKPQTYADAVQALTTQAILLPEEMISHIQEVISNNKDLGYTTIEEFVKAAVRGKLEAVFKGRVLS